MACVPRGHGSSGYPSTDTIELGMSERTLAGEVHEKSGYPGWLGYIGDEILSSYIGSISYTIIFGSLLTIQYNGK